MRIPPMSQIIPERREVNTALAKIKELENTLENLKIYHPDVFPANSEVGDCYHETMCNLIIIKKYLREILQ
jgi:hypothetical protein